MLNRFSPVYPFLQSFFHNLPPTALILDVGTSSRFAKELKYFRPLINPDQYFALGFKPKTNYGANNCDISGDVLKLPFKTGSADVVLVIEVIEHVRNPFQAVAEIYRILKPGGQVILTTPFLLPYHGKGNDLTDYSHETYPDYWRFTHQGLQLLFKRFSQVTVKPFSNTYAFEFNQFIKLIRTDWANPNLITALINKFRPARLGNPTTRHLVHALK